MPTKGSNPVYADDIFASTVAPSPGAKEIAPLLARTIQFLEQSPNGASRRDILSAIHLQPSAWASLREALERCDLIISRGRGPGLRHIHIRWVSEEELHTIRRLKSNLEAKEAITNLFRIHPNLDSRTVQEATNLDAVTVRRVFKILIADGVVARYGQRRSTRYQWVGETLE